MIVIVNADTATCSRCGDHHLCARPESERQMSPGSADRFLSDYAVRLRDAGAPSDQWERARHLHAAYQEWCIQAGLTPGSQRRLGGTLRRLGIPKKMNNGVWWMVGALPARLEWSSAP